MQQLFLGVRFLDAVDGDLVDVRPAPQPVRDQRVILAGQRHDLVLVVAGDGEAHFAQLVRAALDLALAQAPQRRLDPADQFGLGLVEDVFNEVHDVPVQDDLPPRFS